MKTITREYKIYKFNELSEEAKENAIKKQYDINVDYDWWRCVYEDAAQIGLKITGFDIDRGSYCKGNFTENALDVANKIIESHGKDCETYKDAQLYVKAHAEIEGKTPDAEDVDTDDIDDEFLKTLLEDYRITLSREYDYLTSKEAIIETIEANDYDFTEDGKLF